MSHLDPYKDFTERLTLLVSKHPPLITTTLSNIFTMRLIGNKTHGDLAEIAIAEFINQYMYPIPTLGRYTNAQTDDRPLRQRTSLSAVRTE